MCDISKVVCDCLFVVYCAMFVADVGLQQLRAMHGMCHFSVNCYEEKKNIYICIKNYWSATIRIYFEVVKIKMDHDKTTKTMK